MNAKTVVGWMLPTRGEGKVAWALLEMPVAGE
jgi:hypothetical protein